mgnify:CR=1 FL=1
MSGSGSLAVLLLPGSVRLVRDLAIAHLEEALAETNARLERAAAIAGDGSPSEGSPSPIPKADESVTPGHSSSSARRERPAPIGADSSSSVEASFPVTPTNDVTVAMAATAAAREEAANAEAQLEQIAEALVKAEVSLSEKDTECAALRAEVSVTRGKLAAAEHRAAVAMADTMEAEAPKERSKSGAELLLQMTRISALQHILSELSCAPPPAPDAGPYAPPRSRPPEDHQRRLQVAPRRHVPQQPRRLGVVVERLARGRVDHGVGEPLGRLHELAADDHRVLADALLRDDLHGLCAQRPSVSAAARKSAEPNALPRERKTAAVFGAERCAAARWARGGPRSARPRRSRRRFRPREATTGRLISASTCRPLLLPWPILARSASR